MACRGSTGIHCGVRVIYNNSVKYMNPFDLETLRTRVLRDLSIASSARQQLFVLKDYFGIILAESDEKIITAYLLEFLEDYIDALKQFDPFFLPPEVTYGFLDQINKLKLLPLLKEYLAELKEAEGGISGRLEELENIFSGVKPEAGNTKIYFPVMEIQNYTTRKISLGLLETITIEISKGNGEDKFIIVPSTGREDSSIEEQIQTSWKNALNFVKTQMHTLDRHHKVIVHFDHKLGQYIGYSLGMTLTIGFIEELLAYYNTPVLVHIKSNIALTGGIDRFGRAIPLGKKIIEEKVETVFYSDTEILVVPESDKHSAQAKLNKLFERYPNRKLKVIGVSELSEVINRRDLIDIRKQNPIVRSSRAIRKHIFSSFLTLVMLTFMSVFSFYNLDDNPAILEGSGQTLFVKNKTGKVLWTKEVGYDLSLVPSEGLTRPIQRLVDIDGNGENELLLSGELHPDEEGRIVCFGKEGNLLWKYSFRDTISSKNEVLVPSYGINIIDTLTEHGRRVVYLRCNNGSSYSAAIFKLDLLTGKRLEGTFWHPGHFMDGFIMDINKDGEKELVISAINNSFEKIAMFAIRTRDITGTSPAIKGYQFYGSKIADFVYYILIPRTDYSKLFKVRNNTTIAGGLYFNHNENRILLITKEGEDLKSDGINYKLSPNLKDFDLVINTLLRIGRDTLVAHGKLQPPYTDTPEYCEVMKKQILYWNGKEFVTRKELN